MQKKIVNTIVLAGLLITAALGPAAFAEPVHYTNVMNTVREVDMLSTFVAAVEAAGLAEVLNSREFTIFAPTNEAFAALPEGKLDRLLLPENREVLIDTLTYHVIPRRLSVDDFRAGEKYSTVNGHLIHVFFEMPPIKVNQKISVVTSIASSNAIVYLVDMVILPPEGPKPN